MRATDQPPRQTSFAVGSAESQKFEYQSAVTESYSPSPPPSQVQANAYEVSGYGMPQQQPAIAEQQSPPVYEAPRGTSHYGPQGALRERSPPPNAVYEAPASAPRWSTVAELPSRP
jgi:hypothetical protein